MNKYSNNNRNSDETECFKNITCNILTGNCKLGINADLHFKIKNINKKIHHIGPPLESKKRTWYCSQVILENLYYIIVLFASDVKVRNYAEDFQKYL